MPHAAAGSATWRSSATGGAGRPRCTRRCCSRPARPPGSGTVADGTTVSDADEDEKARRMSISASLASFEWRGVKVNLIDTPGEPSFVADALGALRVCESAVFVVNGVMGVEVSTQRLWQRAERARRRAAHLREHARPRAGRLLPHARRAEGRLRAARRGHRDPDRRRARAPRPDRPRGHEGLRVRRGRARARDPDPRRPRRAGPGVPREADGRGGRELRGADGALPRGRGDLPRGDRRGARGRHGPRPHLPRHLRRGDHPPGRRPAARRDRRRPAVARPARRRSSWRR